jgi:alkanesulfonate monooxygenase SsuD/methylene tetrahydromethanopterin reductase-like flavin-dependent oxidoreductase (luciferase family)
MDLDVRRRGHTLRFGIVTPPMWRSWDELLDLWIRAERAGFDLALNTDHFLSDWDGDGGPTLEAWTMLGGLAREVPRIGIGTYVTGITHRPIAVLAKQAATIDHLSGGRLILGLGAAWNEAEHAAYGIPFPSVGTRVGMVGEALEALRSLESRPRTTFQGAHVAMRDAPFEPKPVRGHIPILIGSTRPRMMALAARGADLVDFGQASLAEVRAVGARMVAACRLAERDPASVAWVHEEIGGADPAAELTARVRALAPLGISVFLVNIWPRSDPAQVDRAATAIEGLRRQWAA